MSFQWERKWRREGGLKNGTLALSWWFCLFLRILAINLPNQIVKNLSQNKKKLACCCCCHCKDSTFSRLHVLNTLTSLTLIFALADDSRKAQLLNDRARLLPWSLPTTRSSSRSHLLPTKIIGTSSVSLTRNICSRKSCKSLNVDCAVIEYTNTKPCPFFI